MQVRLNLAQVFAPLIIAVLLFGHQARAEECRPPKVFFVNGVLNQPWEAQDASRQLETALTANGAPSGLHITTLYNPTDPGLGDAIEVAQDYILTGKHLTAAWWLAYLADVATALAPPLQLVMMHMTGGKTYMQWLVEQMEGTAAAIRNEDVIVKIQGTLLREVKDNKTPVVVIAHSEGNFYLNEAIRRLKTADATKDIPGVQAIGVLGIGVASRLNPATLPSGQRLYSYVTKSDDAIIVPLQDALSANFTNVVDDRVSSSTLTHHELVSDYLYPNVKGTYNGVQGVSIRKAISDEFNKVYSAVSELFPCVDNGATVPTSIVAGQPVSLSTKTVSRNGAPILTGSVEFSDDKGTAFCASTLDGNGQASCSYTFPAGRIPQKIYARWESGVFQSLSHIFDAKASGTYWSGMLTVTGCTQKPNAYTRWAWEVPCYNIGPYFGAYSTNFYFDDDSDTVILQSRIQGLADVRKLYNLRWRSMDQSLRLSIPSSSIMSFAGDTAWRHFETTREFELIVTARTSSTISGTFTIRAVSGLVADVPSPSSDSLQLVATETTGTWTASRTTSIPNLQMNGFDLCIYGAGGAGGLYYMDVSIVPFTAPGGVNSLLWAEGQGQRPGGTCSPR